MAHHDSDQAHREIEEARGPITALAALIFCLAALTHAVAAQKAITAEGQGVGRLDDLHLEWLPTTALGELAPVNLTGLSDLAVEVGPFEDRRRTPHLIGESRRQATHGVVWPVGTQDDVGSWTSVRVRRLLHDFGMRTVETDGDVVLTGEVRRLWVVEDEGFEGDLGLMVHARDRDGEILYSTMVGGFAKRFGPAYDESSYVEAISEALLEAVHSMVTSDDFRESLATGMRFVGDFESGRNALPGDVLAGGGP